jgi:hypothetical protein
MTIDLCVIPLKYGVGAGVINDTDGSNRRRESGRGRFSYVQVARADIPLNSELYQSKSALPHCPIIELGYKRQEAFGYRRDICSELQEVLTMLAGIRLHGEYDIYKLPAKGASPI